MFGVLLGVGIWVMTWVLPLTFMIVMAWGCETHARQLGRRTLLYYDGEAANVLEAIKIADAANATAVTTNGRSLVPSPCSSRSRSRSASLAMPSTSATPTGFDWLDALGALVALSLVIATAVIASRK